MAQLPEFVNLELNGNQFSEAAVEAMQGVLQAAGKVLGGEWEMVKSCDDII